MTNYKKHAIIVGTARSGTSWLSETLAQKYRYRLLYEPEQETQTKQGYLLCDQWLTKPSDSIEAYNYLKRVFANRIDCDWIAQNSNRKFKMHLWPLIPKKFIIKFVRCNLSAPYMNTAFGIPVIHIVRNPYEVLASQSRVNFQWLSDLSQFIEQDNLVTYIKNETGLNLDNLETFSKLKLRTLRWCIENIVPLQLLDKVPSKNYVFIKYEDLAADINVFYNICQQFDMDYPENIEKLYTLPSSKVHSSGTLFQNTTPRATFNLNEMKDIQTILDIFDLKRYPILNQYY